jgi:hypothetical protein
LFTGGLAVVASDHGHVWKGITMSRVLVGTAAAVLALAVSACGSDTANSGSGNSTNTSNTASTATSGAAGADAVAWADKVCKSVESEVGTLTQEPKIDTSTPESAKAGLTSFLNDFGTALDRLIGGIKSAGDPPVADGKQVVDETTKGLEQAKQTIQDAQTKLAQTQMNDPAAVQQALTEVAQKLTSIGNLDATKSMEDHAQLKDAFEKAPTCKKLDQQKPSSAPSS